MKQNIMFALLIMLFASLSFSNQVLAGTKTSKPKKTKLAKAKKQKTKPKAEKKGTKAKSKAKKGKKHRGTDDGGTSIFRTLVTTGSDVARERARRAPTYIVQPDATEVTGDEESSSETQESA